MEEFLTEDFVSTEDICSRCIFFSKIEMIMINWWQDLYRSVLSLIILVINNRTPASCSSDFVNHSCDYRPTLTSLGSITITKYIYLNCEKFLPHSCHCDKSPPETFSAPLDKRPRKFFRIVPSILYNRLKEGYKSQSS